MKQHNLELLNEIPAMPRYFLLEFTKKRSKVGDVFFRPVIGWAIEAGTYKPYPITCEGLKSTQVVILYPSGQVDDYDRKESFENIASWCMKNKCLGANIHEEMLKW